MIRPKQVIRDFGQLKRGEGMVYYRGFIARDRSTVAAKGDKKALADRIGTIASFFWQKHAQGKAYLLQRKLHDYHYEYMVMKK